MPDNGDQNRQYTTYRDRRIIEIKAAEMSLLDSISDINNIGRVSGVACASRYLISMLSWVASIARLG